ncbi:MAG: alpha/beta hydrolase [Rhodobacteraceae bacterium]|nr:alpha/beta hydrolase [Paracoccaceae bacterium]
MSLTIHRRTFGSGARPVLAIHCSLAHSGAWRGLSKVLEGEATLHAFDMPCHGKSGEWDPDMGDLHDVTTAEALKLLTEPMDVIGHSFGATVALRLACERPDLVRSVVSYESVWFAAAMLDEPEKFTAYVDQNENYEDALDAGDRMLAARIFNRGWGDGSTWDNIPMPTRQYMADRIHFVKHSGPFVIHDAPDLLGSGKIEALQTPVLLMQGEKTAETVDAVNAALARRLTHARRATLPGIGHMGPITHPVETAEAIREFWASING